MKEAYQFISNQLKDYDGYVIAGISGGPDSMALLHLLLQLREESEIKIICAHVNHNVRKESADEAANLKQYCLDNKIIFEMTKIEDYSNDNFENEARIRRYAFFEELINKYNSQYLLTAHHGDDLIETILMRIVRGSTFKGYAGFSRIVDRHIYKILRPLINLTKEDIIKYNKQNKIKYANDLSNMQDIHTRNRYRKNILPFLKKEDINVHEKFVKFSQMILKYNEYIEKEMNSVINTIYNLNILNIEKFLKTDGIIQDKIINYIMEQLYQDDLFLINDVHTNLIKKLIISDKPNTYIYLPNGYKAIKTYKEVTFTKKQVKEDNIDYKIELNSNINLPNGMNLELINNSNDTSNFICHLNSQNIKMPIYVRSKKNGDVMYIKGMKGHKKVKDIFINEKISTNERDIWPIVVDSDDNILWLPGLKKSKYDTLNKDNYDIIIRYY